MKSGDGGGGGGGSSGESAVFKPRTWAPVKVGGEDSWECMEEGKGGEGKKRKNRVIGKKKKKRNNRRNIQERRALQNTPSL